MLKGAKYFIIMVTIFCTFFILCKPDSNRVIKVNNSSPKYPGEKFVKFEKLYRVH